MNPSLAATLVRRWLERAELFEALAAEARERQCFNSALILEAMARIERENARDLSAEIAMPAAA